MFRLRYGLLSALLLLSIGLPASAQVGDFRTQAQCQGSSIAVTWTYHNDPGGYPQFVAYDVYRQSLPACGDRVRLNADPFPRSPGQTHSHTFVDTSPAAETMYRYDIEFVDQNRMPLPVFHGVGYCDPCVNFAFESCPSFSAPIAHGTLLPGFYPTVNACPGTCYGTPGCQGSLCPWRLESYPAELQQYVGTGIEVRLYGGWGCELTEGCYLTVTRFDVTPCGVLPVDPASWGKIKSAYK